MTKRGCFIALEGCDKSGKTTQCKLIAERLTAKNIPVRQFRYPERSTRTGALIDAYLAKRLSLSDDRIHLLFAINRRETVDEINEYLNKGTTLIVDRYSFSGIAYSAIKKGMEINFCKATELGLPKPDEIIFLDYIKRSFFGDEIYENEDTQSRVYRFYKEHFFNDMTVVDADRSVEEINNSLMTIIENVINRGSRREVFDYENLKINGKYDKLVKSMDSIVSNIKKSASVDFIMDLIDEAKN